MLYLILLCLFLTKIICPCLKSFTLNKKSNEKSDITITNYLFPH